MNERDGTGIDRALSRSTEPVERIAVNREIIDRKRKIIGLSPKVIGRAPKVIDRRARTSGQSQIIIGLEDKRVDLEHEARDRERSPGTPDTLPSPRTRADDDRTPSMHRVGISPRGQTRSPSDLTR